MTTQLLAHQGGWDEILLVAGPLAVFAAVLWLANKRANARLAERATAESSGAGAGSPDASPGDGSAVDPLDVSPE